MEIEPEEYVRTKQIAKVIGTDDDNNTLLDIQQIITKAKAKTAKHSKDIIDLIEAGDIIEVYMPSRKEIIKVNIDKYYKDNFIYKAILDNKVIIKSILTHEQYLQNCYRLEE